MFDYPLFSRLRSKPVSSKNQGTNCLNKGKVTVAIGLALILSCGSASAKDIVEQQANKRANQAKRQTYQLVHQDIAITVDGEMNEAAWQQASKVELKYENRPSVGNAAIVKTEAWFYENGERFFIAIKAYDPDPSQIRASFRDRDAIFADDNVGIIIDTFNDERSGYEFFVNPLGAQADMRMTDTNGWNEDSSWDAIWDSAGKITEDGYVVEMSIPFNALRFPQTDGPLTWNIAFWRNYSRDIHRNMSNVMLDRDINCNLCQFDKIVGFDSIKPSQNFQLTPTLTMSRNDSKDDVPGDWQQGDIDTEPGIDVRWGISQDMVMNATFNPDFSQVEADASQLDVNNTFSLFFPEKRPFFLDGASYFDTNNFNLVHTRNIAEPDYGVKLTGKNADHSYGVMVANDTNTSFLVPGNEGSDIATLNEKSQVAIARYKMDVGEHNNVGVLLTHRSANDYHNTVASIDGNYWINEEDSLNYQLVHSDSENPTSLVEDEDYADFNIKPEQQGHALSLNYAHKTKDYNLRAGYQDVGKDFRADLGFQNRVNFKKLVLGGSRTWYGDKEDTLTQWGYFGDWDKTYDQDGNMLEQEYEFHGNVQGPKQLFSNFGVIHRTTLYDDKLFNENQFMAYAEFTPIAGLRLGNFVRFGKQIDYANSRLGDVFAIVPNLSWDANEHLRIHVMHDMTRLNVDGGRLFTANLTDARISYQFDMRSILKLVVQYTDIKRDQTLYHDDVNSHSRYFSTQLIYSYKINPQSLVYLGYSDGGYQNDELTRLEKDQRSVFAKFSYAWQL
jgi:hypothetical protein